MYHLKINQEINSPSFGKYQSRHKQKITFRICSAKISQFTFPVNLFGKKLSGQIIMWHSACLVSARHASPPRGRDCQEERGRANRPTGWGLVGLAQTWSSLLLLHNIAQSKVSIRKHGMRKFIKGSYSYWPIFACWWKKAFLKKIVSISHYYSLWLYVDGWTENETPAFLTRQMISFHGGLLTDAHLVWAAGRVLGNRSKSDYVAYWVEGGEQPISPGISFCWSRFYLAFIILSCAFYIVLAMEEHSWKLYVGVSHL